LGAASRRLLGSASRHPTYRLRLGLSKIRALLDTGMNQDGNVSRKGKRLFALTQIYSSTQQRQSSGWSGWP
jgi:hypothetical protein